MKAQCRAGKFGGDPADDFLVGVMGHGKVERRFSELDGEDVQKAGKNPGKIEYQWLLVLDEFATLKLPVTWYMPTAMRMTIGS